MWLSEYMHTAAWLESGCSGEVFAQKPNNHEGK